MQYLINILEFVYFVYLLLNAASYDGEISHADAYRHVQDMCWVYVYRGRRYENNDFF